MLDKIINYTTIINTNNIIKDLEFLSVLKNIDINLIIKEGVLLNTPSFKLQIKSGLLYQSENFWHTNLETCNKTIITVYGPKTEILRNAEKNKLIKQDNNHYYYIGEVNNQNIVKSKIIRHYKNQMSCVHRSPKTPTPRTIIILSSN